MILYSYYRSSAAYRVRIALNLKGLAYDVQPVHLTRDGGEQRRPDYLRLNPQGLVPALATGEDVLTQSLAIIEYLEETCPIPPLLPQTPEARALVRALAQIVAADIHPLNNLRVLQYLQTHFNCDETGKTRWIAHWISAGFDAIEKLLEQYSGGGPFCVGDTPTLADICLVPQVYNALRFNCELEQYPRIIAINAACQALEAFRKAAPENQADAGGPA